MDTTRADRCSFTGYDRDTTPCLAALAREGTVYLDAWSPAGWTAPAHASLFSGLRPEHHGLFRGNREYLGPEADTIAEQLEGAGYRTARFSNNDAVSPSTGLTQGFEVFVPLYEEASRPYPWAVETHARALRWALAQHRRGEPFFLFINDMEPHIPYTPPEETAAKFRRAGTSGDMVEWGRHLLSEQIWKHNLGISRLSRPQMDCASDLYDAEIRCLDELIGALVEGLRAEGILDETLFIVTADHGENLGEHGLMDHVFSLHRTIRHVPMLIRYPARFEGGREVREVVRLEDVPPTILEVCGLPLSGRIDGQSLLEDVTGRISRAILGPPTVMLDRLERIGEMTVDSTPFRVRMSAVYDGRHHLIRTSTGREEFYDVLADPREETDLAGRGGETLDRLRALLPTDPIENVSGGGMAHRGGPGGCPGANGAEPAGAPGANRVTATERP